MKDFTKAWTWRETLTTVFLAIVLLGWMLAAYVWNPAKTVEKEVAKPVAKELGLIEAQCPGGWRSVNERELHLTFKACYSGDPEKPKAGDWLVILYNTNVKDENDQVVHKVGDFNYAVQVDTPGAKKIEKESEVPGWKR